MKEILFFLVIGFLLAPSNPCSTVFVPFTNLDTGRISCAEGFACPVFIRSHPTLYTKLSLSTQDNQVKVWLLPSRRSDTLIKLSDHQKFSNATYTSDPRVGYLLELERPSCDNQTYIHYEIERTELNSGVCRPFQQTIGHEITIVHHNQYASENIRCSYELTPGPGHQNETLYLLSSRTFTIYTENSYIIYAPQDGNLHVVDTFRLAFFYVNYSPKGLSADERYSNEIIGVLTNQSCSCGNEKSTIALFERITLQSPGYPNFLCPNTTCTKSIEISRANTTEIPEKYVAKVLLAFNAQSHSGVSLSIKTNDSQIILDENSYRNLSTALLLQSSDLTISYKTGLHLSTDHTGQYRLNLTLILVHKECECSIYSAKGYTSEFRLRVEVPDHCLLMSCYWKIEGGSKIEGELQIQLENGGEHDHFHLWNRRIMKLFQSKELNETKSIMIEETNCDTHLVFWRTGKAGNTTVLVSWEPKTESSKPVGSEGSSVKRSGNNTVNGSEVIQKNQGQIQTISTHKNEQ